MKGMATASMRTATKPAIALGLSLLGALSFVSPARAVVLYSDDFNANSPGLDAVPDGWSVTDGTVDIIGICPPGSPEPAPGGGCVIDLDGTSGDAGVLSNSVSLPAGSLFLNFYLQNLQGASEIVDVTFGTATLQITIPEDTPWTLYSLAFAQASSGFVDFSFANQGGDNSGALLDNVSITDALPPPAEVPAPLPLLGAAAAWRASRRLRRRRS